MYLSFYGFHKKPFQINTNPSFFWFGTMHKEALALLKYGITENKGFLLLTGDVGTGKTTLINALINSLGDEVIVAKVPDPGLEMIDFMNYISHAFEMKKKFHSKESFLVQFGDFLATAYSAGKKVLLVIDESQRLSLDLLEEIRQLSNIEKQATRILNILFIGQNEFNDVLLEKRNRALHQRIAINYALRPFDFHETGEYIRQSLKFAGTEKEIFNPDAIRNLYEFSGGFLRRINIISDHTLLSGYLRKTKTVTGAMVKQCVKDLCLPASSKTAITAPPVPVYRDDSETSFDIPPERMRTGISRGWKTFGTVNVVAAVLFIVTYIYYPSEYQIIFNQLKNKGIHAFNVLWGRDDTPNSIHHEGYRRVALNQNSDRKTDIPASNVVPVNQSIEQGLLVENVVPAVVVKEDFSDNAIEGQASSDKSVDFPKIQAIGDGILREAYYPAIEMEPFFDSVQEKQTKEIVPEIIAVFSKTAEMLGSEKEQSLTEDGKIATIGTPENPLHVLPPVVEIEKMTMEERLNESVYDKNIKDEETNKDKPQETASNYGEIQEFLKQKTRNEQSDKPAGTEGLEENQKGKKTEYMDPGAVIDWVIKKRAQ
jgi:type II secretory pathway predicted ATPase ExeA